MSTLFNIHSVVPYISVGSSRTKASAGQRLSTVTYKVDKATGTKPESKAVSIPALVWSDVSEHITALQSAIMNLVQKEQDSIVRNLVEAGTKEVSDSDISMVAILESFAQSATSGRLTGDAIREWFTESLRDGLLLAFASKLGIPEDSAGTSEQQNKLSKILKGYEDSFAKLASGAASFTPVQKDQLIKALSFAPTDDFLSGRFIERLSSSKVKESDLLESL